MSTDTVLLLALLGGVIYLVRFSPYAVRDERRRYCPQCGYSGAPRDQRPGSTVVTLILAFLFVVPALIYEAWRSSARRESCPSCGHSPLIASPRGGVAGTAASVGTGAAEPARRECPHCAELIMERARVCKHCSRDVSLTSAP